ncbi:MAG: hypothetical protein ACFFDI_21890 [Promethearchaeota archaeon]
MIIGSVIIFFGTTAIYGLRFTILAYKATVHIEMLFICLGEFLIIIGMITGGKATLYGSSRVLYINIYDQHGLSLYQGSFTPKLMFDEQLVSGVVTAVATIGKVIKGEESVSPKILDYESFAILLERKNEFVGCIFCEQPSEQIRYGLRKIITDFEREMSQEQVSSLIDKYLPYGEPEEITAIDLESNLNK